MAQITSKKKHSKLNAAKVYDQQYLLSQTSSLISQYQNTLKKLNIAQWPCTKRHPLFPDPFSSFLGSKNDKKKEEKKLETLPHIIISTLLSGSHSLQPSDCLSHVN